MDPLTRVSRKYVEIDVVATLPGGGSATISGVDVAMIPINAGPDAATSWTAATYATGTATVLLAGPDAGGSGALVVPSDMDLWAKVTDAPEVDAVKIARVNVVGGTPAVLPISTVSDAYVAGLVSGSTATHTAVAALSDPVGSAATARAFAVQRANHTGTQAASTVTGLPHLNAEEYGFLTGNTAAANNAALTAAVSAAVAAGKSLYIPGHGIGTPYLVSAPLAHPGGIRIFGDPGKTYINNTSNTSALVTCTGSSGQIADLFFQHTTTLDASTGNGIEVNNVDSWTFERVQVYSCGWAFKQTGGFFFTNYLEGMNLKRFWSGAVHITGGTGSQWNNTYINNIDTGVPQACIDSVVRLEELDESVFNQLNIEWVLPGNGKNAVLANGGRTVNINSLHLEHVNMFWFDSQMVRAFGNSRLIVDAMTVKFCDIAPTSSQGGGRTLMGVGSGAIIDVRGLTSESNTNTSAQAAKLAATDSDASGRLRITAIKNDVWTAASTGIGLREIGDPIFVQKAGALTTTELPYSGMIGVDTTNSKLYVNVAGTVKSVTVA